MNNQNTAYNLNNSEQLCLPLRLRHLREPMAAQRDLAARRALLVRHGRRRGGRDGRLGEGYPRLVGREAGDADVVVAFCANITI